MAYGSFPVDGSYWYTTVSQPEIPPAVDDAVRCDFAIIGGGYTGLTAALDLAEAGADVVLLEAETPGWGASGRNGGFCCLGAAKLSAHAMVLRYGAASAQAYHLAERAAVDLVEETVGRLGLDVDRHSHGETLLAHRPRDLEALFDTAEDIRIHYGLECEFLDRVRLEEHGISSPEFYGALNTPVGFALNPLKYALGLATAARSAGARIFANSPVLATDQVGGAWQLKCPGGVVQARKLLVATNGYSSENLPEWMAARFLPVQSNILATRPLTNSEIFAQGWTSTQMCYDTRNLLHYFRLMPDRRMLFGMRGAVRASDAARAAARTVAWADFDRIFPEWRHVETPHFWSGLVAVSRELVPFAGPIDADGTAFAAMCYHGNGVAMGSYAGGLLADLALGRESRRLHPAIMKLPPRRFPFGRFRRAVLPLVYTWYRFQDGDLTLRAASNPA